MKKERAFITGSFDLFHAGHCRLLKETSKLADQIFVGVNTDERIRKVKGEDRPIFPLQHRLEILDANQYVTEVRPIRYEKGSRHGIRQLLDFWEPDLWVSGAGGVSRKHAEYFQNLYGYKRFDYVQLNCEVVHTTHLIERIRRGECSITNQQ